MKAQEQVIEILKAGNVTYPKATLQNIYNAFTFLAQQIDKLKENELKLIGTAKLLAEEVDKLKENDITLKKAVLTCTEDIDRLGEPDAVHAINKDDVLAATYKGDPVKITVKRGSESEPRERWSIGAKDADGNWGMSYGPFVTLQDCLNIVGSDGDHIIHFVPGDDKECGEYIVFYWEDLGWVNYLVKESTT